MRKRFPPTILLSGDHDEARNAMPFALAKLKQMVRRLGDKWGASDIYRDVFPDVDVRIEVSGSIQTIFIEALGSLAFSILENVERDRPDREVRQWLHDPATGIFTEKFTLIELGAPWYENPHAGDDIGQSHWYANGTIWQRVEQAITAGREMPVGAFKNGENGWAVIDAEQTENLVEPWTIDFILSTVGGPPPDFIVTRTGATNELYYTIHTRHKFKDGRELGLCSVIRTQEPILPIGPDELRIERFFVTRDSPAVLWTPTNNTYFWQEDPDDVDGIEPVPAGVLSTQLPTATEDVIWNFWFREGQLQLPLSLRETFQDIKEYDIATGVNTLKYRITHPDSDAALIALGQVEFIYRFLQDPENKWCGFSTWTWATAGGQETADVHYYIAPIEDILDGDGNPIVLGGMANAVKMFTFNLDDHLGMPGPVNNGAFIPRQFWHVGGGKFAFAVDEDIANATVAAYPIAWGTWDWELPGDIHVEPSVQLKSGNGWNISQSDFYNEWWCGRIHLRSDITTVDYATLDIVNQTSKRWADPADVTYKDTNGDELPISEIKFGMNTRFAFSG